MSESTLKIVALSLLGLMYISIICFPKIKMLVALLIAGAYVVLGILPEKQILKAIDWNVITMIAGTMLTVYYFVESQMPDQIAITLLRKAPNTMWAAILMSLFSGIVSAFIDNVATVLIVAPIGIAMCRKLKINPQNMIIAIAVSSNLQGAATLVGDTTSIMLAAYAKMNFADFFWTNSSPGIFFAVELGALATIPIMILLFRKDRQPVKLDADPEVNDYIPSVALLLMVILLIAASFLPNKSAICNGLICIVLASITMLGEVISKKNVNTVIKAIQGIDYETLGLLIALFCVIAGINNIGIIDDFAFWIVKIGGNNLFLLYTMIVWGSVLISAFLDNIPYVAAMLPVISAVSSQINAEPYLLYLGLLSGATLGGNLTPIGASANITALGLLRKQGYEVKLKDFTRIGIPFTFSAIIVGYLYIWFFMK